ncbi:hypothetical protein LYSHEL_12050 [Lysobacter helvus]|uniref:Lipoprotein n=2 Tax=Lysobacteraceae TaxID=32033 RepID=A0ABN6FUE8_9GAMM|nr:MULTISPECIES: hypothetical protein [Lysobacter]BCT92181.1 hypothetical protein LYSCAS_12050 [Lysobacter caseinilyticus]BCT95334.1 hypothetical protein LYSHEL_12050 [Lysobacter helvus]
MRTFIHISGAVCVAIVLAACGKSPGEKMAEAAIEAGTGQKAEVDADKGAVTFKTDKGDMKVTSGDQATLPANFPKDVYLPAGYKVGSAMEMPGAMVVDVEAPGTVTDTFAAAVTKMKSEGWTQRVAMQQTPQSQVVVYEKANRDATLSISENPGKGGVRIGVQVTTRQ